MATQEATLKVTPRQREGRAINAVAELLRAKLSVPNIYLEPPRRLISADLLAVDRAGAGDLHAVEIKFLNEIFMTELKTSKPANIRQLNILNKEWEEKFKHGIKIIHKQLMSIPSHFRYLAIPLDCLDRTMGYLAPLGLFSKDGIGRLGVITIVDNGNAPSVAEVAIKPERFRMDSAKLTLIETKLLDKSRPDIEVRI